MDEAVAARSSHFVTPAALLARLANLPADRRDQAFEHLVGVDVDSPSDAPPGRDLVGYHASALSAVVRALCEVPLGDDDVFVDLGAGLGKVAFAVGLLTCARVRGIEVQGALVAHARRAARALGLDGRVTFDEADVRDAKLDDGTVFFLYAPFTGPALDAVLARLRTVAEQHSITVIALGVDLGRASAWLAPRPLDAFWLSIYDSVAAESRPHLCGPCDQPVATKRVRLEGDDAIAIAFGHEARTL